MVETLSWHEGILTIIDQTNLPGKLEFIDCTDYRRVILAIARLEVRGAPAIGAAAAFALVLAARELQSLPFEQFLAKLAQAKKELAEARPTAVNLAWALARVWQESIAGTSDVKQIVSALEHSAQQIYDEDIAANKQMGKYGAELLAKNTRILTHCNAGALATCGWGTALGVIREANEQGKISMVYADETRPLLQGSRITAWELKQDDIPVTLITDSMAGWVMKNNMVDAIITGADRIALNGDSANKIGTYTLAVLAKRHDIPFYIAAPRSTIDFSIQTGDEIPIEQRAAAEVTQLVGAQTAPLDIGVFNPAFDVTPHELITGIITEYGVLRPPYDVVIKQIKNKTNFEEAKH